jgi:ADP-heptose:LPS heptosyltransferase
MLKLCGLELAPARFDLHAPDSARDWAAAQVPESAVHFSINASTHLKEWPLDNWIELAKRVSNESQIKILATGSGSARESSRLNAFGSAVGARAQIFCGISIAKLAALLSRCSLHVGADSGVLHLAMALGLPTISLFRNYPSSRAWVPRGQQHRSFTANCACVGRKYAPCLKQPVAACLQEIQPGAIAQTVRDLLASATESMESKKLNG